jgi:hypothetical protein
MDVPTLPVLVVVVFGAISLVYDAAHQSFPPVLVPGPLLTPAYARLEQTSAVAQTGGPVLAGALVKVIGAPLAILTDAASYLISGIRLPVCAHQSLHRIDRSRITFGRRFAKGCPGSTGTARSARWRSPLMLGSCSRA